MIIKKFIKEKMLCKNLEYMLCYRKGCLVIYQNDILIEKKRIHPYCIFPSIIERIMRLEPRCAIAIDFNKFLFTSHGAIFQYSIEKNIVKKLYSFSNGMNNPLSLCIRKNKAGNIVDIIYGEYIWNTNKGKVSIYRLNVELLCLEKVYSFHENTVTHIHNVIFDKFNDCYLILTGDLDEESGIWKADIDFNSVEPIIKGSQKYRACVLLPTKNCLYYVTDTPLAQNYIYRLDRDGNAYQVSEIPGPCIFGIEKNGYLYFATSVEGDPTLGRWKYRFSNKLGKGVKDRYSHLFRLSQDGKVEEIGKMKKDCLPMWLFEFGNMKFPVSDDDKIYICPQSLKAKYGTYVLEE